MKKDEIKSIEQKLHSVLDDTLSINHIRAAESTGTLLTEQLHTKINGKGSADAYNIFSGIVASFNTFLCQKAQFQHSSSDSVLEIYYCRNGRIGWNMRDGIAIYLGAGDLTAHSMACCADSDMMFPLGYAEGISVSVDLKRLSHARPKILDEADVQAEKLQERFCSEKPFAIPTCSELEHIFAPLFGAETSLRLPLLKLKVIELLIYLSRLEPEKRELTQYFSQQTELIKEIHQKLTDHLDQRFTIEELSKQYLINTSTLKEVFKAVYGLPIATYMKEYRVHRAMKLLRESDATISEIASQVGYETQGKFSKAFKDVTQVLPTEYRKIQKHQSGKQCNLP